jgi:phosphohistidine phosphatase
MHVILVRHGKAQNGQSDSERSLSQDGFRIIENLGMRLKQESEQVSQIWHSLLLRAKETAEILYRHLLPAEGLKEESFLTPHSDPLTVQSMLESEARSLLIVSHLPFLEYLANLLVTGQSESDEIQFPPGGAVKLQRNIHLWKLIWTMVPDGSGEAQKIE